MEVRIGSRHSVPVQTLPLPLEGDIETILDVIVQSHRRYPRHSAHEPEAPVDV